MSCSMQTVFCWHNNTTRFILLYNDSVVNVYVENSCITDQMTMLLDYSMFKLADESGREVSDLKRDV